MCSNDCCKMWQELSADDPAMTRCCSPGSFSRCPLGSALVRLGQIKTKRQRTPLCVSFYRARAKEEPTIGSKYPVMRFRTSPLARRRHPKKVAPTRQTPEPKMVSFAPRLNHVTELRNLYGAWVFGSAFRPQSVCWTPLERCYLAECQSYPSRRRMSPSAHLLFELHAEVF